MPKTGYETFEINISRSGDGKSYAVNVRGERNERNVSPVTFTAESVLAPAEPPPPDAGNGPPTRQATVVIDGVRKTYPLLWTAPPPPAAAQNFGAKLFRAIFREEVLSLYTQCLKDAESRRAYLRIALNLSAAPELAVWPWEYLHKPELDQFLAMFSETPLIRHLQLPYAEGTLEVAPPLRVLVAVSLPKDVVHLNAEAEIRGIREAAQTLPDSSLIEVEVMKDGASLDALYDKLNEAVTKGRPFHIFHYIGHGIYDAEARQGKLLFVGDDGLARASDGSHIGARLNPFKKHLRLVILNACEGARLSRVDSYAGVATKILQVGGIPAALAMQFKITDKAAVTFAKIFYQELLRNKPLEEVLATTRLRMYDGDTSEWATPVLYMCARDGYILQLQPPQAPAAAGPGPRPAPLAHLTAHFGEVSDALNEGKLVIFLGLNVNLYGRPQDVAWRPGNVLPSSAELFEYLKRTYNYPRAGAPIPSLAQHLVVNRKKKELYDAFDKTFNDRVRVPQLYPFLAKVVKEVSARLKGHPDPVRRRPLILTTNYDKSVERALNEAGGIAAYHVISYSLKNEQVGEFQHTLVDLAGGVRRESTATIAEQNKETILGDHHPVILKLPGTVEGGVPNYVVTEDHFFYLARNDLLKMLPKEIVTALTTSRHLYLGYNIQDWPFRALLYSIWGDRKPKYDSWAVIPDANDPNKPYWKDSDLEVIEAPLDEYIGGLQQHLFG